MIFSETIYEAAVRAARRVLPALPLAGAKLRAGVEGRAGVVDRISEWARDGRGDGRLVWFHAPSVGEGLQLGPVIDAVREQAPDVQSIYTFFSPSAEPLADRLQVTYADYLPYDVSSDVREVLDAVRPDAIVFGKTEVWPTLTREAKERGIALGLVSATVASESSRLRVPARWLLAPAYSRLDLVGAISAEDAERLVRLGVPEERIDVTGDARFDQAWSRAKRIDRTVRPLSLLGGRRPVLVAGSTWPEDERRLLPALDPLRRRHPGLTLVIAPHEPTPEHLGQLERGLIASGFAAVRLSQLERGTGRSWQALLVDRVGVLAELYGAGDMAYVGGGFGRRGLHSVLEPAAVGIPVAFGPRHGNAREAAELASRGGAVVAADEAQLERIIDSWLREPTRGRRAGAAAQRYVEENLGASERNAEVVLTLLE